MRDWLRRHLTYANVVSTACLFIVLGGTSYAALKISGKNVKRETLTGANVKDGSLLRKDFKKGELPRGRRGKPGPRGSSGAQGPQGSTGPSGSTAAAPPAPTPIGQRLTIAPSSGAPIVFPVLSSSFDGSLAGTTGGGGGGGSGKAAYEDLVLTKPPDASAGALLDAEVEGTHFLSAKLEYLAPSGASASLQLGETFITDFANVGSGAARTQTVGLKVGDPANLTPNPPKLTWAGPTGLPTGMQKVGEMTISGLAGPIDLFSVDWDVKQMDTLGGGGSGGKAAFGDLGVVKAVDSSSPALLEAMKSGKTFAKAEIRLLQPGSASLSTRYTLTEAQVTDYRLAVGPNAPEALKLGFRSIEQGVPGPGGTELKSCWDLLLNTDCG